MNALIKITNENGTLVVSSREVAENFGKEHKHVLEAIKNLVAENSAASILYHETTFDNRGKQYPMYLMTRDGFTLLAMGFTGKDALEWKLKYIQAFNEMEQQLAAPTQALSPQLQVLINLELQQKQQAQAIADTNARLDSIGEIIALNPSAWRVDARNLIVQIARKWGGNEFIKEVNAEVFRLVDARAGASLATRLQNMRQRMSDEGICKSKRDKLTKVDVIEKDKKLIEIYLAIVKEMAVQNGIGQKTA